MYSQEIESMDHEMGVQTEWQNAMSVSRMAHGNGMGEVRGLCAAGYWVLVEALPAYCRYTDAQIGHHNVIVYATRSAEAAEYRAETEPWDGEGCLMLYPPEKW